MMPKSRVTGCSVKLDAYMSSGDFTVPSGLALCVSGAGTTAEP